MVDKTPSFLCINVFCCFQYLPLKYLQEIVIIFTYDGISRVIRGYGEGLCGHISNSPDDSKA